MRLGSTFLALLLSATLIKGGPRPFLDFSNEELVELADQLDKVERKTEIGSIYKHVTNPKCSSAQVCDHVLRSLALHASFIKTTLYEQ